MKIFFAAVCCLFWFGGAAFGQSALVTSFESPVDLAGITLSSANDTLTSSVGVTDGLQALQIDFLPTPWPYLQVNAALPQDWSAYGGLAFDVFNPTGTDAALGMNIYDTPNAAGSDHARGGNGISAAGQAATFFLPFQPPPDPAAYGMRALPPVGPMASNLTNIGYYGNCPFDRHHIAAFRLWMHAPTATQRVVLDNVRLVPAFDPASLTNIVDAFGQYAQADWPGKLHSADEFAARQAQEQAALAAAPGPTDRDRFGGWAAGPQLHGSGFFRTAFYKGKWWLLDPDGHLFFSSGVDTVNAQAQTLVTGREAMFSWLPTPADPLAKYYGQSVADGHGGPVGVNFNFYAANLERKYGAGWQAPWQQTALARLHAWGFNTLGAWADAGFYGQHNIPYTLEAWTEGNYNHLTSATDIWSPTPDPFDPRFAAAVAADVRVQTTLVKNDPWFLGYFLDNELRWAGPGPDGRWMLGENALAQDAAVSPAKRVLVALLLARYGLVANFNAAWGLSLSSWKALNAPLTLPSPLNAAQQQDLSAFGLKLARQYFAVVRAQLKAQDPNHLYLGCRFADGRFTPEALQAATQYCDVLSFNVYNASVAAPEWSFLSTLSKPCIIGEFHFGATDRGMFSPGLVNAGSQAGRAQMYQNYVTSVLQTPTLVGCHWFQYADEPLTGRSDGENYNIGLVDATDTPYPELTQAAQQINGRIYALRGN